MDQRSSGVLGQGRTPLDKACRVCMVVVLDVLEAPGFGRDSEGENEGDVKKERECKGCRFGHEHGGSWATDVCSMDMG